MKEQLRKERLHDERVVQRAVDFARKKSALEHGKVEREEARVSRAPKSPDEIRKVKSTVQQEKRMEKIEIVRKFKAKPLMKP